MRMIRTIIVAFLMTSLCSGGFLNAAPPDDCEVGQVILANTIDAGVSAPITFKRQYTNPVIIAYIMTRVGGQSVDVRVKDVTSTGCTLFLEEPDDEGHNPEAVGYLVLEAGSYQLDDGTHLEAGMLSTASVHRGGEVFDGDTVTFTEPFSTTPVVLHTLNTYANGEFMTSVSPRVTSTEFDLQQEAGETGSFSTTEMIGWVAIDSGSRGVFGDYAYETGRSQDGVGDGVENTAHYITYATLFTDAPIILVDSNSGNGQDGSWARASGLHTREQHGVFAEEDQIGDDERSHADEVFGWWAMSPLVAEEGISKFEVGQVVLSSTIDQEVQIRLVFEHIYSHPVVIAYIMTRAGGQSIDVRVKDVTATCCTLFLEEPDDEGHNPETVGYLVLEAGSYQLNDGTHLEAGILSTASVHRGAEVFDGDTVTFTEPFSTTPVVLHTLNTYANGEFMTSVSPRVTNTEFDLQQEAGETGSFSATEMIGWVAIDAGARGVLGDYAYETGRGQDGTNDGVENTAHIITYTTSFTDAPIILVDSNSGNGQDGSWARASGLHTREQHGVFAEEDQIGDVERSHVDEVFGWWAMGPFVEEEGIPKFEVGQVVLNSTIDQEVWTKLVFEHIYSHPVVIAYIMTRAGGQSIDVRVKDVTSTGCTLFLEEPDDEGHNPETVGYLVLEAGSYQLDDGTHLEAGILFTVSVHRGGEVFDGDTVTFTEPFSTTPVVLHTLNTYANGEFMTSVSPRVTSTEFDLQQEAGETGSFSTTEMIGWVAIDSGVRGVLGDYAYETGRGQDGTNDGVENTAHIITYTTSFTDAPIILVDSNSGNGQDGSWARASGLHTYEQHGVFAEEDQIGDEERSHVDEVFGWWAMTNLIN